MLLKGSTVTPLINTADTQNNASDKCVFMGDIPDWFTAQDDVRTAYAAVNYTNMQTQADTQAGLEKAWLQAWYLQQYWATIKA